MNENRYGASLVGFEQPGKRRELEVALLHPRMLDRRHSCLVECT